MKSAIIYPVAVVALLAGGFTYLQVSGNSNNLFNNNNGENPVVTTTTGDVNRLEFKNYGPAPEFNKITKWFNSDPLVMADLKGKVVLINFWTYSCLSCVRNLPYFEQWHQKYGNQGLVVVGVHTPEYAFEKVTTSLEDVLARYKVTYPIAQDNSYALWNAYDNQFWPAIYLIDKEGKIVYTQFGDGPYDLTENAINNLLELEGGLALQEEPTEQAQSKPVKQLQFGTKHSSNFSSNELPSSDEQVYTLPERLRLNTLSLEGIWKLSADKTALTQGYGRIRLYANTARVQLAAQSIKPVKLKVTIDGKDETEVSVHASQNYELFKAEKPGRHIIEIEIPQPGFEASSFILD